MIATALFNFWVMFDLIRQNFKLRKAVLTQAAHLDKHFDLSTRLLHLLEESIKNHS